MNIDIKNIVDILALYNISSEIADYSFFINSYNKQTTELKIIVKVNLSDKKALVVKLVKEDKHPHEVIEQQSRFSEHLRNNGILTPKRYKSMNGYCIKYNLDGIMLDVTVEDYLREEIKAVDKSLANQIGRLMGKIHSIAQHDNLHISASTIFDLLGYNEASGYDEFERLGKEGLIKKDIFDKICGAYQKRLDRIKYMWSSLPKYATQGDYSINNLTLIDSKLGIFDYNIAGDAVLVSDMILQGLLVANEMDLSEGLNKSDKPDLFSSFIKGYENVRKLTSVERLVFEDIFAISNALWFTRIKYNDNSLSKLVERKEYKNISELLQKIYLDIN